MTRKRDDIVYVKGIKGPLTLRKSLIHSGTKGWMMRDAEGRTRYIPNDRIKDKQ